MSIHLPAHICGDFDAAARREWLVTNGIGGFASGTVIGAATRRYHGLLVAALRPPLGRTLLVARLDETLTIRGREHLLYTSVWQGGAADPAGWQYLRRFDLSGGVPTWTYEIGPVTLRKRIWMEHGHNVTHVRYDLDASSPPATLTARLLVNYRDYHHLVPHGQRRFQVRAIAERLEVCAAGDAVPVHVGCLCSAGAAVEWQIDHTWYRGFHLPVEAARGFDHLEDHLSVGLGCVELKPGESATFAASAADDDDPGRHGALERCERRAQMRLQTWADRHAGDADSAPAPLKHLVLAADQFIVARPSPDQPDGHTIVAGYPWFTDWGRDTMIALPGLTLTTGRFDIARQILRTWARHVEHGLIPNRFPDAGDRPEYHTADATLWYLWAIDQYVRATGDVRTLAELFPLMCEIVDHHRRGTIHNIHVDDGLLHAGGESAGLTWMDARIGERVITARTGKPIELSALWYDALCNLARLADLLERSDAEFMRLATRTRDSFQRFWNAERRCCRDVLDGPGGDDATLRPNQIFAVSLTHSPLPRARQTAVVAACERHLLTPVGLRTLGPREPGYRGRYVGGPVERDEAYHQGTAWGWLLGPFVLAHYRVHHSAAKARQFLRPMAEQLRVHGVGSLSEIFDADEPHTPAGCIAQAWTVAETLRAWHLTQGA